MKYLSLFSGIGGFELGLKNSNYEFECVGASEIDKYAKSIYFRHFLHKDLGDAKEIDPTELQDFDLLVGGFPCQAFSIAGERRGFNDTRGTLFFEIARICAEKQPRYLLLENVKGLLSHNGGRTFKKMLGVLSELGYDVEWEILNSKHFSVPQNRERVFIKGYFRDKCGGEILHQKGSGRKNHSEMNGLSPLVVGNISPSNHWRSDVYGVEGISPPLTACDYKFPRTIKVVGNLSHTNHGGEKVMGVEGISSTLTTTNYKHPLKILESDKEHINETEVVDKDFRIRKLTPLECERLQAFPDGWTEFGKNGEKISDTQRYRCLGNAVTTTVVTYLANNMFRGHYEN